MQTKIGLGRMLKHLTISTANADPDMSHQFRVATAFFVVVVFMTSGFAQDAKRRSVLFVAVDDLNHWMGHLGRNSQTITPNFDRLATMGVSFSKSYCAAPACNPSRAALMSGMRPSTTGVYFNSDDHRPHIDSNLTLNAHFRNNGYRVLGAGKIYHGSYGNGPHWDQFAKRKSTASKGSFIEKNIGGIRWAQLKGGDDVVSDYHTVSYCIQQLKQKHDKPLFLACGIFRPHMPWSVPKKYFEMHPIDGIELPPYRKDDLSDIPMSGVRMAKPTGDHRNITEAGVWKEAVQAYLASVTYADAQLGRLLDALEESTYHDEIAIVLWSDHGWHLGEKSHWRKFALWEESTRTALIWVVPGMTPQNVICKRTVDLMSVYPTLCELAAMETPQHCDGRSIVPLLRDPNREWDHPAITTYGFQNHSVRTEGMRYTRYEDGGEELYDEVNDPYEWKNLAEDANYFDLKEGMKQYLPRTNKPRVEKSGK